MTQSHWSIGLPLVVGTLLGMAVLAKAREHLYTTNRTPIMDNTIKRRSKEELVEELMRRVEPRDDYDMKPVL